MGFDPDFFLRYGPGLLKGLLLTVEICAIAIVLGLALGLAIALLMRLHIGPLAWFISGYIAVLRGTPLLVQLFILYYGGPAFGIVLSSFEAGILGLAVYASAYFAEIFRAGFEAIQRGQIEAARVLGFSRLQIFREIELRQMMALVIPVITNEVIILVKESAMLSIITVPEVTFATTRVVSQSFAVVEPYLMLSLLYWIVAATVSRLGRQMETALTGYLRR
jgi:polar amino acid transport system permease protein